MNKRKQSKNEKNVQRSQLARRLLLQYLFTLIAFFVIFCLCGILTYNFVGSFIWQPDDPLYRLLCWVRDYLPAFIGLIAVVAWVSITYYYISKPLRYLDEIIAASEQLASPSDAPISLPPSLRSVQDELNLFREQAIHNAYLAKEAEQRKNDLIVYLAHDLKTPLTSIIGYLTLLRDEPQISPELRARYTGIALDKAERLDELLGEFFDITRFNLTALTLEPERISLSRMLEQTVSEFDPVLAEKELTWRTEIAPDVIIRCDPDKLARVFDNLIRNAVNYSYPRTGILLSMQQREDWVRVLVKNHGKTIPPDKLERIFEQFFRLDSSRSTATGGSGLGLSIAREITELHGGRIRAESADESITFTVYLPVGGPPPGNPAANVPAGNSPVPG